MKLTKKQRLILKTMVEAGSYDREHPGRHLDLDQIIKKVPYDVTKQAIQFSLRSLKEKGLLKKSGYQKRRGANRCLWVITDKGSLYLS